MNDDESIRVIHRYLDVETSSTPPDMYGVGHNEELVGWAIKGRDEVVLATRFGDVRGTAVVACVRRAAPSLPVVLARGSAG